MNSRIRNILVGALAFVAFGVSQSSAQQPDLTAPPVQAAYSGSVGDWALGRWVGEFVTPRPERETGFWELVVEKGGNGKVGCRWARPDQISNAAWVKECSIGAATVKISTSTGTTFKFQLEGADLKGTGIARKTVPAPIILKKRSPI